MHRSLILLVLTSFLIACSGNQISPAGSDGGLALDGGPVIDGGLADDGGLALDGGPVEDGGLPGTGTVDDPIIIPGNPTIPPYNDVRDTHQAPSDTFDSYPPNTLNESGPEFVYRITLAHPTQLMAYIHFPEPAGVDIDLHLLKSLNPLELVARGHYNVEAVLQPGHYYLVLDTFVSGGVEKRGSYNLTVKLKRLYPGTMENPIPPAAPLTGALFLPFVLLDSRDTREALSDSLDSYPPNILDESGPEYIYAFTLDSEARLAATVRTPEPDGVDVDLHLLRALTPVDLIQRDNDAIYAIVPPGTYYLSLDTYVSSGAAMPGPYNLRLAIRKRVQEASQYFNHYILAAVDYLYANYRLLGYGSAVLTHDIPYGTYGTIKRSGEALTMCVAAVMEVILTAMILYAEDTGDMTVFDYLPKSSWETLHSNHIKAHLWVNSALDSYGSADALKNFGMGENIPFESLEPGSFINVNRNAASNYSGHAVIFISFIDIHGNEYNRYNDQVIGFKYFSSQGGEAVGTGGLDFRYAIFEDWGAPEMPYKRDINIVYSTSQHTLNTGMMFSPPNWSQSTKSTSKKAVSASELGFDEKYFTGWTVDD